MKYIDAEKLIKKVRFARDNFYKQVDIEPKDEASLFCGMYCDALLQQIQSLQQEHPSLSSNLDEAAKKIAFCVCKYLPSGIERDSIIYYAILAAIAGAEWMAGQISKAE